jgi:carbon monoxide dehydrogenase subunit G
MKLAGSYTVGAPRDKVFAAITDPAVLQKVIDGCEKMVQTGEGAYDAHLKIGVAGLKGSYVGKIQMKDIQPPESYTLTVEGKGAGSFVKGVARIQLRESSRGTELQCDADGQVGGMIAAIGSRLIDVTAKKMMDDFFRKFAQEVMAAKPKAGDR